MTFEFGANGSEEHNDGNDIGTSKSFKESECTLELTDASKVYYGARDAAGNSVLKIGTGSQIGTFTFTVGGNVNSVLIKVAKYKANDSVVSINGEKYTLTKNSNDGEYDVITIDTTTVKTITFSTVGSTRRCMINSIELVG